MSEDFEPARGSRSANERQAVLLVYILYLVGLATGLASIIGVIIAHLKWGVSPGKWDDHYRYQVRTFWLGVLASLVFYLIMLTLVGIPVAIVGWIWVWVWTAIRTIKGLIRALDDQPIDNPATLFW